MQFILLRNNLVKLNKEGFCSLHLRLLHNIKWIIGINNTTASYENVSQVLAHLNNILQNSEQIEQLSINVEYKYERGGIQNSFTTSAALKRLTFAPIPPVELPTVETGSFTYLFENPTQITLLGQLQSNGAFTTPEIQVFFDISQDKSFGAYQRSPLRTDGFIYGELFTGLTRGKTYYYRAGAIADGNTVFGETKLFDILQEPAFIPTLIVPTTVANGAMSQTVMPGIVWGGTNAGPTQGLLQFTSLPAGTLIKMEPGIYPNITRFGGFPSNIVEIDFAGCSFPNMEEVGLASTIITHNFIHRITCPRTTGSFWTGCGGLRTSTLQIQMVTNNLAIIGYNYGLIENSTIELIQENGVTGNVCIRYPHATTGDLVGSIGSGNTFICPER